MTSTPIAASTDAVDVRNAFARAWLARDLDAMLALTAEDAQGKSPVLSARFAFVGKAQVAQGYRLLIDECHDLQITGGLDGGAQQAVSFTGRARAARIDGAFEGLITLTVDDAGRITAAVVFMRPWVGLMAFATVGASNLNRPRSRGLWALLSIGGYGVWAVARIVDPVVCAITTSSVRRIARGPVVRPRRR